MTVTGDGKSIRKSISLLYENLMANTTTGREEVDIMLPCEAFNGSIFSQVLWRFVLHVVVESEHRLLRVVNFRSTNGFESVEI